MRIPLTGMRATTHFSVGSMGPPRKTMRTLTSGWHNQVMPPAMVSLVLWKALGQWHLRKVNTVLLATIHSKSMRIIRIFFCFPAPIPNKCKYPGWLTYFQHWHTLDYRKSYTFHHRNTTLKISNNSAVDMSHRYLNILLSGHFSG